MRFGIGCTVGVVRAHSLFGYEAAAHTLQLLCGIAPGIPMLAYFVIANTELLQAVIAGKTIEHCKYSQATCQAWR